MTIHARAIHAACVFALFGLGLGLFGGAAFEGKPLSSALAPYAFIAGFAFFAAAHLAWEISLVRSRFCSPARGYLIGAVAGLVVHPIFGLVFALWTHGGPLRAIPCFFASSFLSLFFFGWLTILLGGYLGMWIAQYQLDIGWADSIGARH